jgi:hypothetical protein
LDTGEHVLRIEAELPAQHVREQIPPPAFRIKSLPAAARSIKAED